MCCEPSILILQGETNDKFKALKRDLSEVFSTLCLNVEEASHELEAINMISKRQQKQCCLMHQFRCVIVLQEFTSQKAMETCRTLIAYQTAHGSPKKQDTKRRHSFKSM